MDAFDADVLIYAAVPDHPLGRRVRALFESGTTDVVGIGSTLLIPELLSKPLRNENTDERRLLAALIGRLDLIPVDTHIAELATVLGARYRLRAADAVHLATAVSVGADRFITNNTGDFTPDIVEIDVTPPNLLPDPGVPPVF